MAEELRVEGSIRQGIIVLVVIYDKELLLKGGASERLSKELTMKYRQLRETEKGQIKMVSCIVQIRAEIAGSPLVRALFELWREVVEKEGGQVVCVGYPPDYIDSLTSLGLSALPGFALANDTDAVVKQLTT